MQLRVSFFWLLFLDSLILSEFVSKIEAIPRRGRGRHCETETVADDQQTTVDASLPSSSSSSSAS
jgi:hypothetical protein